MLPRDLFGQLQELLRPLQTRVANAIARAVVQRVDDSTKLQLLQLVVLAGETVDDAERFQEYGFTSSPPAGAEAVVLFPNGDRAHPLVIAVDDRSSRLTGLSSGEVALYNKFAAIVKLKADGTIEARSTTGTAGKLATKLDLDALLDVLYNWTPVANDGGAALKTALTAEYGGAGYECNGTEKLKAE